MNFQRNSSFQLMRTSRWC